MSSSKRRSKGGSISTPSSSLHSTPLNWSSRQSATSTPLNRSSQFRSTVLNPINTQLLSVLRKCSLAWTNWLASMMTGQTVFDACVVHLLRRMRLQAAEKNEETVRDLDRCLTGLLDSETKLSACLANLAGHCASLQDQLGRLDALIALEKSSDWKTDLVLVRLVDVRAVVVAFATTVAKDTELRWGLVQSLVCEMEGPASLDYLRAAWETVVFVESGAFEEMRRVVLEELGEDDENVSLLEM